VREEKEIIEAVVSGDLEAFSALVRAHQTRVRLSCLIYLGNKEEADDAAQDVFVKAFKGITGFKGEASFETWLLRIADNHCRDILRTRKSRRMTSLDALLAENGDAMEGLLTRTCRPGETPVYSSDDLELLGRLFSALPQEDREVLALREGENLPYEEIAQRLSCSLDAVKGRLKRARAALSEKCRHFLDTSAPQPRL
jgi:RNA polymerase sigma-70 factor (ECF subfamily)